VAFYTAIHAYARATFDPDTLISGAPAWTPRIGMTDSTTQSTFACTRMPARAMTCRAQAKYRKLVEYILTSLSRCRSATTRADI